MHEHTALLARIIDEAQRLGDVGEQVLFDHVINVDNLVVDLLNEGGFQGSGEARIRE